jgi:flagellar biosynthesis/type III secretory pathway chaperone
METFKIEDKYQREALLFQDLLNCLDQERDNLMSLNLENLWTLMGKKQEILESLEGVQGEIKLLLETGQEGHPISHDDKKKISKHSEKIACLKEKVHSRVKENVSFIQESLGFFDELIQIFTHNAKVDYPYKSNLKKKSSSSSLFLYKEV